MLRLKTRIICWFSKISNMGTKYFKKFKIVVRKKTTNRSNLKWETKQKGELA